MDLEKEVKQLRKENTELRELIIKLDKLLYITDEALDVILNKQGITVRNTNITDLYELTTFKQSSKTTVRYYYKQEYLLSAPEDMKEELQLKFNELMNLRPKLSFEEVKQELKTYKNDVTEEPSTADIKDLVESSLIDIVEIEELEDSGVVTNG